MKIATYDTNLTDAQWAYLKPMLPQPAKRGRPPKDRRRIMDAILYLVKCGCPWRYLPADFPNWKTVYHIFRQWVHNHQWAALNDALRLLVRKTHDKRGRPTAAILDSQSVKSAGHGGPVGYDAGKRIKGRKRHLLVDTLGLVLGVTVTPANTTERDGAQMLLGRVLAGSRGCASCGWMVATPARTLPIGSRASVPNWPSKSSNAPIPPRASKYWLAAGSSSAPSAG